MNGVLAMLAVVAIGVVLLVIAASVAALHGASRPRGGVRHHSYSGDGGVWSGGWGGGDGGGGSCGGGDGGGGGGGGGGGC